MKKLFSVIAASLLICSAGIAQTVTAATPLVGGTYGNTIDTVVNTASIIKYDKVTQSYPALSIQVVITKISGTVGGTVVPVGSNDGINFVALSRASVAATTLRTAYSDTLVPANQTTNTKIYTFTPSATIESGQTPTYGPYLYYGIKYTGTGTMSAKFRGYIVGRK